MRFKIVHVTNHAKKRWQQRIKKCTEEPNVKEIIESVKNAKHLKKDDYIPYITRKKRNTIYCYDEETKALFVLECVNIEEYRLVTILTDKMNEEHLTQISDDDLVVAKFFSATAERKWLLSQKATSERIIQNFHKGTAERQTLVEKLQTIDEKLRNNKPFFEKEKGSSSVLLPITEYDDLLLKYNELKNKEKENLCNISIYGFGFTQGVVDCQQQTFVEVCGIHSNF